MFEELHFYTILAQRKDAILSSKWIEIDKRWYGAYKSITGHTLLLFASYDIIWRCAKRRVLKYNWIWYSNVVVVSGRNKTFKQVQHHKNKCILPFILLILHNCFFLLFIACFKLKFANNVMWPVVNKCYNDPDLKNQAMTDDYLISVIIF